MFLFNVRFSAFLCIAGQKTPFSVYIGQAGVYDKGNRLIESLFEHMVMTILIETQGLKYSISGCLCGTFGLLRANYLDILRRFSYPFVSVSGLLS